MDTTWLNLKTHWVEAHTVWLHFPATLENQRVHNESADPHVPGTEKSDRQTAKGHKGISEGVVGLWL